MTKSVTKKNLSSMQVIKTLEMLVQDNYTMQEIINKLNLNESDAIFNNSVISKYINTCRFCGINIEKFENKYYVKGLPFGFKLTDNDISLINILQNIVRQNMSNKNNKLFDKFIDKLNRYSLNQVKKIEKYTYYFIAERFEHAVTEKRKIKITLKNKSNFECIPITIIENQGKFFLQVLLKNKDKIIDITKILNLDVLNDKYIQNFSDQVVIFELKGDLAKRYSLRENERIIKNYDGNSVTVSNRGESKEILFARLLRYDNKCEILNPKIYREEMSEIIKSALSNYDEVQ